MYVFAGFRRCVSFFLFFSLLSTSSVFASSEVEHSGLSKDTKDLSLINAAKNNDVKTVSKLIDSRVDLEIEDNNNSTALILASACGYHEVVDLLIKAGANLEARDKKERTALVRATYEGHVEVVKQLIAAGANLEARCVNKGVNCTTYEVSPEGLSVEVDCDHEHSEDDVEIRTPVFLAFYKRHYEVAKMLISAGASLEGRDYRGYNALLEVADSSPNLVSMLLKAGFDPNSKSKGGTTALMLSVCGEDSGTVKLLLDAKADPNAIDNNGRSALIYVMAYGDKKALELLIGAGVDLNIRDNEKRTVLHEAIAEREDELVNVLIDAGANIEVMDDNGITPLILASQIGSAEIVEKLFKVGAKVNATDKHGRTALMLALELGGMGHFNKSWKELIKNRGAGDYTAFVMYRQVMAVEKELVDVFGSNDNSELSIITNMKSFNEMFSKKIRESGFDWNPEVVEWGCQVIINSIVKGMYKLKQNYNKDSLEEVMADVRDAVRSYALRCIWVLHEKMVIETLVKLGADVEARDNFGRSALMWAAERGFLDVVAKLMKDGADLNVRDNNGDTALTLAISGGHYLVAKHIMGSAEIPYIDNGNMAAYK